MQYLVYFFLIFFKTQLDPHAAQMVFHSGVKVVQIPLSVTHTALFGPAILAQM
jgi:inosine-uridine nucleoside N-ribohydrolase